MNENYHDIDIDIEFNEFDEEIEQRLERELAESMDDLDQLIEDHEHIGNPDSVGKVVLDEVWKQFGNQIGLDITAETLNQKYDREHAGETYADVGKKVMQDDRYKNANKEMKEKLKNGNLKDEYTGKIMKRNDKANLDHTVSRKELYENERRKQANIATEDLANKKENLNATNESLNKSKKEKSVKEMRETREIREAELKKKNEKTNKKIDESNVSDTEKRLNKEKNNKRLQDKLDADDELMKKADEKARKSINKEIAEGVAKETGKKAGKDALKAMAVQALFELLKQVINALVRFIKSSEKSFKTFLSEMKIGLQVFFSKIASFIRTGVSTLVGTIVTEIFGPIISVFQSLASIIKQGFRSLGDAVAYLGNKENKDKSFSIKVAEVGKIIVAGLGGVLAVVTSEAFEKVLIAAFPPLGTIIIPLLGSLANIIALFLSSLMFGIIVAIVINMIDKAIASQLKSDNIAAQIERGNDILSKQKELLDIKQRKTEKIKNNALASINKRNNCVKKIVKEIADDMKETLNQNDVNKREIERLLQSLREE